MLQRLQTETHLWLARLPEEGSDPPTEALHANELRRAETLHHHAARRNFLAGRTLLRTALSHYASIEPQDWRFEETVFGRPEIVSPGSAPPLRFNLSHTNGLVACVITNDADCGVDVETVDRRVDILGVADHSFSSEEADVLRALAAPRQQRHFFSLWTLKEAYVKARGEGIRLRLDAACFEILPDGAIHSRLADAMRDRASEWQFALFAPSTNHLLATALRCDAGRRLDTACRILDFEGGEVQELPLPPIASTGS